MKIPKYIKDSIIKSAKHYEIARNENEKIRLWINGRKLTDLENGIINNCFIDCVELSNVPGYLIEILESLEEIKE